MKELMLTFRGVSRALSNMEFFLRKSFVIDVWQDPKYVYDFELTSDIDPLFLLTLNM